MAEPEPTMHPRELVVRLIKPDEGQPAPDVLKRLAELLGYSALLGGLILSLGWSYAYGWFEAWKMPLSALSIEFDHLFEYGRLVIVGNLWPAGSLVVLFVLIGVLIWRVERLRKQAAAVRKLLPLLMVLALLVVWLAAHWLGKSTAQTDFDALARGKFQLLPTVEVTLNSAVALPADFAKDLGSGLPCYRLVYTSPDAIWIARTRDNDRDPMVAMIPLDEIATLRIYPRQGNCPPGG